MGCIWPSPDGANCFDAIVDCVGWRWEKHAIKKGSSFFFLFVVTQFRFDDDWCNELVLLCFLDRTFEAVNTGGWTANFQFVGPFLHLELACAIRVSLSLSLMQSNFWWFACVIFWRSWQLAAEKRVGEMNCHGHSTDRVWGGGEFGAMGPGVKGQRHCIARFGSSVIAAVVVVVSVGRSVFRSFHFAVCLEAQNRNPCLT